MVRLEKLQAIDEEMKLESKLFHAMRGPLPGTIEEIDEATKTWEKRFMALKPSPRDQTTIHKLAGRIRHNAHALLTVKQALERRAVHPSELLHAILVRQVPRRKKKNIQTFIRRFHLEKQPIRVAIDWIGPHFLVPRSLAPLLSYVFVNGEGAPTFGGLSAKLKPFSIPTKKGTVRIPIVTGSFSLEVDTREEDEVYNRKRIIQRLEQHEKWHDFESLMKRMRDPDFSRWMGKKKNPPINRVQHLIENWFRDELSASVLQWSDMTGRTHRFVNRIQEKIYPQLADDHPTILQLRKLEKELIKITTETVFFMRMRVLNPHTFGTAEMARLISRTPVWRIRKRLRQFNEVFTNYSPEGRPRVSVVPSNETK